MVEQREFNKASLLLSLQAEIETNLISINLRYSRYSSPIRNNERVSIRRFKQLDKVFSANLNKLGDVADVAFVVEIVGFYRGLEMMENWTYELLSREYNQ